MPKKLIRSVEVLSLWIAMGLFFEPAIAQSNIATGTWRTHLNYSKARIAAAAGDKIFCSTGYSVFFVDNTDGSIGKMTKQDGLNDLSITAIGYHPQSGIVVMGSSKGNIDLIDHNKIYNIDDIVKSGVPGSRRINHISFSDDHCYVSTDFGVPVIDLERAEIRETYFPGINGDPLQILGSVVLNDTLYLATQNGILAGAINDQVNLIDFRNWRIVEALPGSKYISIVTDGENLYTATGGLLYQYENFEWRNAPLNTIGEINSLSPIDKGILICDQGRVARIDDSGGIEYIDHDFIANPQSAVQDENGVLWIADLNSGLVSNASGTFFNLTPKGPAHNIITRLAAQGDSIVAVSGIVSESSIHGEGEGFYIFKKGEWANYQAAGNTGPLIDIAANGRKIYFASFGDGLMEWDGTRLQTIDLEETTLTSGDISALAVDNEGTLWMIANNQDPSLHSLKADNSWAAYSPGISQFSLANILLVNSNGDKWMGSGKSGAGIVVYNEGKNQSRLLTTQQGMGGLPSLNVNDLAVDHSGLIWAATDKGVAYYTNPANAISNAPIDAFIPVYEGRRLFQGVNITAIAVDPGNRKWIGANDGVWLFNETADELIHHFNTTNSLLPSDAILDIAVNEVSGEVFIATEGGLASYRESATAAFVRHNQVKIFPNPVEPGFTGLVGITGLVGNAQIKITDISGNLIWQSRALGGGISWDVRDYTGKRPKAGVYLVYSSNDDGSETFVGKIAVIN